MRSSNPWLLAEIDALECITRKDVAQLEVVKRIDDLENALREIKQSILDADCDCGAQMIESFMKLVD